MNVRKLLVGGMGALILAALAFLLVGSPGRPEHNLTDVPSADPAAAIATSGGVNAADAERKPVPEETAPLSVPVDHVALIDVIDQRLDECCGRNFQKRAHLLHGMLARRLHRL